MPLSPETLSEVAAFVRGGFEERDRIIEILCEGMYEPGELDPAEVEAAVDEAFATLEAEKSGWPQVTDCDRLDAAFAALTRPEDRGRRRSYDRRTHSQTTTCTRIRSGMGWHGEATHLHQEPGVAAAVRRRHACAPCSAPWHSVRIWSVVASWKLYHVTLRNRPAKG